MKKNTTKSSNIYAVHPIGDVLGTLFRMKSVGLSDKALRDFELKERARILDTDTISVQSIGKVEVSEGITMIRINEDNELLFDPSRKFNVEIGVSNVDESTIVGDELKALEICHAINRENLAQLEAYAESILKITDNLRMAVNTQKSRIAILKEEEENA